MAQFENSGPLVWPPDCLAADNPKKKCGAPLKHTPYTVPRRHMTIAFGLMGNTGMVFAADTEESWGERGDIKTATTKVISGKLERPEMPLCAMAVAGAGNADYLEAVKLELMQETLLNPRWTYEGTGNMAELFLRRFYKKHVVPFWPNITDFELLIGLNEGNRGAIWATSKSTMRPCVYGYDAVGAGRAYASALLSRFHSIIMPLESCALLSIYVAYCVKEFIGGCGKQTQIVVLTNGENIAVDQEKTDEAERILSRWFKLSTQLMRFIISPADFGNIQSDAVRLKADLAAIELLK